MHIIYFQFKHGNNGKALFHRYVTPQKVEQPDIVMGIHPGLHAEGVYEFWEPTLELLLDQNIKTIFTVLNEEEYTQSLERLDNLFCKYLYKGKNPFASRHVKQTPHDPELMWASNQYLIVIKVKKFKALKTIIDISIQICYQYLFNYVQYNLAF